MSQFDKFAKSYSGAVKKLGQAEIWHRENLDRLDAALKDKQARQVTHLRRDCAKSEADLIVALDAANDAHRHYWLARRDALRPQLDAAAVLLAEYSALAKLAGDRSTNPAGVYLQQRAIDGYSAANLLTQDVLAIDGVPQEPPDSAVLEDYRGSWRA